MPELPEVETICQAIRPHILNTKIKAIHLRRANSRYAFDKKGLEKLQNFSVTHLGRRGKLLMIFLQKKEQKAAVFIHLGMSGKIRVMTKDNHEDYQKHDHLIMDFNTNVKLCYNDARRFGWVDVAFDEDIDSYKFLQKLGVEPLEDEFNPHFLYKAAQKRHVDIKSFLLNQHIIAGLGNIYVCEALWRSRIHPLSQISEISKPKLTQLCGHIKDVLAEAIASGGSSIRDHRMIDGSLGYFQQKLAVYGKEGQKCPQCMKLSQAKACIQKITQGGRSSFYCKNIQKR